MADRSLALFALGATREYGARVAGHLGIALAEHEERPFDDGEHKHRPLESVRDRDVYVIHALHGDAQQSVNDKLLTLLFFLATLRDAHARRLTAVIPYLVYARKDRRTKRRDPVTTRYVAQLLEATGVDRVAAVDVHNPAAFENAFRVPVDHLEARALLAAELLRSGRSAPLAVVSPDAGGYKRAERFRELLTDRLTEPPSMAFLEKKRSCGKVSGEALVGDVEGRLAVIVDDLIATGGTLARAGEACRRAGASEVQAFATHGLFNAPAGDVLARAAMDRLVVTDTVPPFRLEGTPLQGRVTVLDSSRLLAEAIGRMSRGEAVSDLSEQLPD